MTSSGRIVARDTLTQLQQLEEFANNLAQQQGEEARERRSIDKVKRKVQQLRVIKARLQKQVAEQSASKKVMSTIEGEHLDSNSANTADVMLSIHRDKLEEIKLAYRLTGVSYQRLKNGNTLLSWDTFYNRQFYESYHIELKEKEGKLQIQHHSIPSFITVENHTELLNQDIQEFINIVGGYLNAYVARRQQVLELQEEQTEEIKGEVKSNQSHDFIQMTIITQTVNYQFTLHYHLTDRLPHQVGIGSEGREYEYVINMDAISQYKQLLKTVPLNEAFKSIISHTSESSSS